LLGRQLRDVSVTFAHPSTRTCLATMTNPGAPFLPLRAAQRRRLPYVAAALFSMVLWGAMSGLAVAQLTSLRIQDYATMPMTGQFTGTTANSWYMARVNFMADEPGNANRAFVNDLNGPLYMLDKTTKQFSTYLDFNGQGSNSGLFDKFTYANGFANGLITFQFDPDYGNNGKFYTVHMEQPSLSGSTLPDNSSFPGFNATGYSNTSTVTTPTGGTPPNPPSRQTVLVEWTDTNINNSSFEGTARELLRLDMQGQIHPMGDLIFNPTATPGSADWRTMYIAVGDGGAGEQGTGSIRRTPQLLNTLGGKILRIVPDLNEHTDTSTISPNGRYRIPNDNPFTGVANGAAPNGAVRDEIWTLGHRNVHRLAWDVDPADPNPATNNHLIVNEIGLHTWEEVNIVKKGLNYGYSNREGPQLLGSDNEADDPPPTPDTVLKDQICPSATWGSCLNSGTVTPTYPVAAYGHHFSDSTYIGDSISSGYVYRGSNIPQLYGKYVFGEITTGQIFYADFAEMLAADDGNPATMATIHSLNILWDNPNDSPDLGEQLYDTTNDVPSDTVLGPMFKIVQQVYHERGGTDPNLPGGADVTGTNGRADIRIQMGEDGELYILSKSDGMIRQIVGPQRVPGDFDLDGDVDGADYTTWKAAFGTTVPVPGLWADGNEDGVVDAADYAIWRNAMAPGVGALLTSVPEPASGWMLICSVLALSGWRRDWMACRRTVTG
jgi:glucose/arabinose dehydrogenase